MIEAKQAYGVHETLRFHKSPDTSMRKQLEELKKKTAKIAHLITSYGLSQATSKRAYSAVLKLAVAYILTSSYMGKLELNEAQENPQGAS